MLSGIHVLDNSVRHSDRCFIDDHMQVFDVKSLE